jgi:hypothetical protein
VTSGARRRGGWAARPEKPPPVTQLPTVNPAAPPPALPGGGRDPSPLPEPDPPEILLAFYPDVVVLARAEGLEDVDDTPITPHLSRFPQTSLGCNPVLGLRLP